MHVSIAKILAATDFSEAADHAVHYAAAMAHHHQAELHIVHVMEHAGPLVHHPDFSHHGDVARAYFHRLEEEEASKETLEDLAPEPEPDAYPSAERINPYTFLKQLEDHSRDELDAIKDDWWTGLEVQRIVRYGHPVEELCHYANHHSIDLMVVGTSGHSRMKKFFVGSVAQRLVQASPCPVLVLRHPNHDFAVIG